LPSGSGTSAHTAARRPFLTISHYGGAGRGWSTKNRVGVRVATLSPDDLLEHPLSATANQRIAQPASLELLPEVGDFQIEPAQHKQATPTCTKREKPPLAGAHC